MDRKKLLGGRYKIIEQIADGMMGPVYRGTDNNSNRTVAIKGLKPEIVDDHPTLLERFIREGEALRELDHPNIVQLLDVVQEGDENFLIMEYVEGGSLSELLREQPQLEIEKVLEISLDLADALTRTHRLGIIHRDLKPQNVLISSDGTPRLSDFGVAHFTHRTTVSEPGGFAGTMAYIPPESFLGMAADERADIWSFGVMLFQMLAGQLPFESVSTAALINSILTKPTPNLKEVRSDIGDDFCDLIYLMLAKERQQRISSARLVGVALEALQKGSKLNLVVPRQVLVGQAVLTNLPKMPTSFIGRKQELDEVSELLNSPDCRLLTLTGPGGVGKTRLSLQVATESLAQYKDGVFFVDLAPINSPDLLPSRVAQALDILVRPGRSATDQLIDFLEERKSLLIFDNFEQIVAAANWVSELLSRLPSLTILITSRRILNIYGEYEFVVPGLSLPPPSPPDSVEAVSAIESVRLFAHRAKAADSRFTLNEENIWTIVQICRKLDGLPLAIELAAARIRLYSPEFLLSQLNDALTFLTGGPRDISERHQTLKAAIDWSFQLLDPDLKNLFVRSAVFHGGQSVGASEDICSFGLKTGALAGLVALYDQSLLRRNEDPVGNPRFEMLETIHQYVQEKLEESGESDEWKKRHAEFFTRFAERGEMELRGPNQDKWSAALRIDYDNMRAALAWSLQGNKPELGLRLAAALAEFWFYEGPISDGEKWIGRSLDWIDEVHPTVAARVLNGAGMLAFARGAHPKGSIWNKEALSIARKAGDRTNQAWSLFWLSAQSTSDAQEFSDGLAFIEEALAIFREIDDKAGLAWSYNQIGEMTRLLGDFERAKVGYWHSVKVCREIGNRRREAIALTNLSYVAQHQGDFQTAENYALDGLALLHDLGLEYHAAITLAMLSGPLSALGKSQEASILLGATQSFYERLSISLQPADQVEVEGYISAIKEELGDEAYELSIEKGRKMSLEAAISYALDLRFKGDSLDSAV